MSSAYYNVLPFIFINLGGEMVYILEQRLREQDLDPSKRTKVLEEILQSMFSSKVVTEIFRPQ